MSKVRICDICGEPVGKTASEYIVKKRLFMWPPENGAIDTYRLDICSRCGYYMMNWIRDKRHNEKQN